MHLLKQPELADILYPERKTSAVDEALFQRPTAIYRGTPFWAWNNALQRSELLRQVKVFKRMGFGGFHLHVRSGMATPYLGKEFLAHIRACVELGAKIDLRAWLYDEDRWPSGFAGGLVTCDPVHRAKYILFTRQPYAGIIRPTPNISCGESGRLENGVLLARYSVRLRGGALVEYKRLNSRQSAPLGSEEWFAYLETVDGTPWFNHQGYVDTLSPRAIERFVEVTHERYRQTVGRFFGHEVPAIFTDEPQHLFKGVLPRGNSKDDVTLPATTDFFETYRAAHHHDLLDQLPEVVWERSADQVSYARYCYHDHVTERFARAYAQTLGRWSERHGLPLTGHMMEEQTLGSQTRAIGDAMRSLAHFQIPGVDMLCDRLEITTVKQAQSVAHQYGRPGVMSELYGVTGWNYDFVGHKAQGDWQAALGVTVRVPHLVWGSMGGEAKRDYPASIFDQSPWWKEYPLIENHFARINVVMTRGRPVVRVAVIHPIESFWLAAGPLTETKRRREKLEQQFQAVPNWLLRGLIDFDFICEALLPEQESAAKAGEFGVGAMVYQVVIVPSLRTIRSTTVSRLEKFVRSGGHLVFAGDFPVLVDAKPSRRAARLAAKAQRCAWTPKELLARLDSAREVDCVNQQGRRYGELFHQLREDGVERHLFIAHRDREKPSGPLELLIRGEWQVFAKDTITGKTTGIYAASSGGRTVVPIEFSAHGHLLLTLLPGKSVIPLPSRGPVWRQVSVAENPKTITLSEPNVLLLDQAEWRWNDEPWQPRDEILRIGNRIRQRCGLQPRDGNDAQPWVDSAPAEKLGRVSLRFKIKSSARIAAPELAIENASSWALLWNGRALRQRRNGHWVDRAIQRIKLPVLSRGENELVITRAYTRKTEIEWCYLLGGFGVEVKGKKSHITAPVRTLPFGDWTKRGLPFYAGNVTYHSRFYLQAAGQVAVRFAPFKSPLLSVKVDRKKSEAVAFAPFRVELGLLPRGWHRLELTAYGNRYNAFGPLHNRNPGFDWQIPQAWRSTGRQWSDHYKLESMGVLVSPQILKR